MFQQLHSRSSSLCSHDLANDLVNDLSSGRGRRSHYNRRDAKAQLRTRRLFGADSESEKPTVRDRLETTVLDVQYATR